MISAHPGKPLIFQRTIYWERGNFNLTERARTEGKWAASDSLMKIACKKYNDVYFIKSDASTPDHNHQVDGTHPDDYGYEVWAKSVRKPIVRILKKYGIK